MLRVQALVGVGRQAEALAASDALIKAGKNPPGMLYWRAQAMYNMDNMDGAVRHMQQAMRSDPDNGEYKTALKLFRKLAAGKEKGNTAFKAKEYVERHAAAAAAAAATTSPYAVLLPPTTTTLLLLLLHNQLTRLLLSGTRRPSTGGPRR